MLWVLVLKATLWYLTEKLTKYPELSYCDMHVLYALRHIAVCYVMNRTHSHRAKFIHIRFRGMFLSDIDVKTVNNKEYYSIEPNMSTKGNFISTQQQHMVRLAKRACEINYYNEWFVFLLISS